jgi:hypothetical protein
MRVDMAQDSDLDAIAALTGIERGDPVYTLASGDKPAGYTVPRQQPTLRVGAESPTVAFARPWPHAPHCNWCSRTYLWSDVCKQRHTSPKTLRCHCGTDIEHLEVCASCTCGTHYSTVQWRTLSPWVVVVGDHRQEWAVCRCGKTVRADAGVVA